MIFASERAEITEKPRTRRRRIRLGERTRAPVRGVCGVVKDLPYCERSMGQKPALERSRPHGGKSPDHGLALNRLEGPIAETHDPGGRSRQLYALPISVHQRYEAKSKLSELLDKEIFSGGLPSRFGPYSRRTSSTDQRSAPGMRSPMPSTEHRSSAVAPAIAPTLPKRFNSRCARSGLNSGNPCRM